MRAGPVLVWTLALALTCPRAAMAPSRMSGIVPGYSYRPARRHLRFDIHGYRYRLWQWRNQIIMKQWTQKFIERAQKDVGVREVPRFSNDGPRVRQYLASIGLGPGASYCAAATHLWSIEAASELHVTGPLPRTGYCPSLQSFAKQHKILVSSPRPGMSFLVVSQPVGESAVRAHHTGVVESVERDGSFTEISANTNLDGSSNGDGVYRRTRVVSARLQFIDWDAIAPELAGALAPPLAQPPATGPVQQLLPSGGYNVKLSGRDIGMAPVWSEGPNVPGTALFPVRDWCNDLGVECGWDDEHQVVLIQGRPAPVDVYKFNGKAYCPVRQLVAFSGLKLTVDEGKKLILVTR